MDVVVHGVYELLEPEDENLFVYLRTLGQEQLMVVCNFTDQELLAPDCVGERMGENARLLIGNYKEQKDSVIRPYEAVVYHLNNMGEPA